MRRKSEFEVARRKKNLPGKLKKIMAVAAAAALVITVYMYRFEITSIGFGVLAKDAFALMFDNNGFPVDTEGTAFMLQNVGRRAVAVSETGLEVFNEAGNKVFGKRTDYRSPLISSKNGRILLFSQSGKNISLYSGEMRLLETETENPIYDADLCENGMIAYSTTEFGYQSSVHVLDQKFNEIFVWLSADSLIMNVSLDKEGKTLAACGVGFEEGQIYSSVFVFDIENGEEISSVKFKDKMTIDSIILSNGNIMTVTDKSVEVFSKEGKMISSYLFEQHTLNAYAFHGTEGICLSLGDYNSQKNTALIRLDSSGKKKKSAFISDDVMGIDYHKNDIVVFSQDKFMCYDSDLNFKSQSLIPDAVCVKVIGDYVYFTTESSLGRIHI